MKTASGAAWIFRASVHWGLHRSNTQDCEMQKAKMTNTQRATSLCEEERDILMTLTTTFCNLVFNNNQPWSPRPLRHNTTQHNTSYISVRFLALARQRASVGGGWHASLTSALPQHPIAGLSRTDLNASAQENNNKPNLQQGARRSVFDPALTAYHALTRRVHQITRANAFPRQRSKLISPLLPPGKEGLILQD